MEYTQYNLDTQMTASPDASGNATIIMGPIAAGEMWAVTMYKSASDAPCTVTMYKNFVSNSNYIDSSPRGSDTGGIQVNLRNGESIIFVYSLITAGTVTASVFGKKYIPGRRSY